MCHVRTNSRNRSLFQYPVTAVCLALQWCTVQRQTAVAAYFSSKQLLPFVFALSLTCVLGRHYIMAALSRWFLSPWRRRHYLWYFVAEVPFLIGLYCKRGAVLRDADRSECLLILLTLAVRKMNSKYVFSNRSIAEWIPMCNLVRAVRAINGLFWANCPKATKFGPDVDRTLPDRFWKWNEMNRALGYLCAHIG